MRRCYMDPIRAGGSQPTEAGKNTENHEESLNKGQDLLKLGTSAHREGQDVKSLGFTHKVKELAKNAKNSISEFKDSALTSVTKNAKGVGVAIKEHAMIAKEKASSLGNSILGKIKGDTSDSYELDLTQDVKISDKNVEENTPPYTSSRIPTPISSKVIASALEDMNAIRKYYENKPSGETQDFLNCIDKFRTNAELMLKLEKEIGGNPKLTDKEKEDAIQKLNGYARNIEEAFKPFLPLIAKKEE